ncbi:MAG: hypothetical protein LBG04_02395 [Holosporaceae bacterium]|jgi:hypothetical protein|nr:hypothetical protein [Holosporaceae bacterium]
MKKLVLAVSVFLFDCNGMESVFSSAKVKAEVERVAEREADESLLNSLSKKYKVDLRSTFSLFESCDADYDTILAMKNKETLDMDDLQLFETYVREVSLAGDMGKRLLGELRFQRFQRKDEAIDHMLSLLRLIVLRCKRYDEDGDILRKRWSILLPFSDFCRRVSSSRK